MDFPPGLARPCRTEADLVPVVEPGRCEGAGDCVRLCPHDVLELRPLGPEALRALPLVARLKVRVHGGTQAVVVRPEACQVCGVCVPACPSRAITLRRP